MHLELLHTEEELKSKLHVLQENVLKDLADAQGNILENQVKLYKFTKIKRSLLYTLCIIFQELLNSLDSIKTNSTEISNSLNESLKVQRKLESDCQVYKPFSSYASNIYFALKDLFIVNRFCQISLATFVKLFQSTLKVIKQ